MNLLNFLSFQALSMYFLVSLREVASVECGVEFRVDGEARVSK